MNTAAPIYLSARQIIKSLLDLGKKGMTMHDDNIDYTLVFRKASEFALLYSNEIIVDDSHHETVCADGVYYACVPLSFHAKGNKLLNEKLLQSGFCTKMRGGTVCGLRISRVLLWIESGTYEYRKVIFQ